MQALGNFLSSVQVSIQIRCFSRCGLRCIAVGAFIGAGVVMVDSKSKAKKVAKGEELTPEDRLPLAMIGGVGFAVTMFWFAWTAEFK